VTDSPRLNGLVQIALASPNPAELAEFYRETLGLRQQLETNGMYFFDAGGTRLMIGPASNPSVDSGETILYFEPADFTQAEEALLRKGVIFIAPAQVLQSQDGKDFVLRPFQDPAGHTLALLGWRIQ